MNKILVANRGEIALRVMRSAKEMGIKTVAVFSEADRNAPFVKYADEAVCIGPPQSSQSYLKGDTIIEVCKKLNVDGIHPGYGFLSENADFANKVKKAGITFIGPSAEAMDMMGDKLSAKAAAKKFNVPMVPGSEGAIKDLEEAVKVALETGFPLLIKASAGGGGKGMRLVERVEDVEEQMKLAMSEAKSAFGDDAVFIEKFVSGPRHIEIQVIGDQYGKVCHLSERDCSIQRRHQKLVEESPSPFMTPELREKMGEAAIKGAMAVNYEGAGTVEFLVDKHRNFYFMEMNTRIQVEHPVTEEVINFDLIKEQIKVASGIPISGKNYIPEMHAIECRINAEDPFNNFRPSPGLITNFHSPGGHGVRVDTHVYAGYQIPPNYDSMIAKLICVAQTREEAICTMERSLSEFVIEGVKTTIPFHLRLMKDPNFRAGNFTTKFMDSFDLTE